MPVPTKALRLASSTPSHLTQALIQDTQSAFARFASAALYWHNTPAPHDASYSGGEFARRMLQTSSVGTAAACSLYVPSGFQPASCRGAAVAAGLHPASHEG